MTRSPRHHFASSSYEWMVEGDIEACFDSIDHAALMDRVRRRNRGPSCPDPGEGVLEGGHPQRGRALRDTDTGTPQGGILSPLLANLALSVLDESIAQIPGGPGSTQSQRAARRHRGQGNCRLVRYADLCRARHKSAYAEGWIMPTVLADAVACWLLAGPGSA